MEATPHAPWKLAGEALMGLAGGGLRPALPPGLPRLPGPALVAAVRYTDSPVGPYMELAVGVPARLGARAGVCVTTMVVSSAESRRGGRVNWGFPKQLGTLSWTVEDEVVRVRWEERGVVVTGRPVGPSLPVLVPMRCLQARSDGLVVVPWRMSGRARMGRVEVEVPEGDELVPMAGTHPGACLSGLRLVFDPARRPAGLRATARAPLQAPEPAVS